MSDSTSALTQWLVFRLQSHDYALPIGDVVEVLRMVALTPMPQAPTWLAGVANLRGRVIPVIDLRRRLAVGPPETPGLSTPIIVVQARGRTVGLLADSVSEVLTLADDAIAAPDALAGPDHAVEGLARAGGRLILTLDLDRVIAGVSISADTDQPSS